MKELEGKVAIVTGAASGIGQAIAARFAEAGAKVVVDYVGDRAVASATEDAIAKIGGTSLAIAADVSDPDQVQSLVTQAVGALGRIDILVNNAGIENKFAFVDCPPDVARKIMNVNYFGTFLMAQAVARQLVAQGTGGRIINISSVHEDLPMPANAAYCASKGAIRMLMRTIAVELAGDGITVNNIGPGAIFTPIDADIEGKPELERGLMEEIPMKRWGKPREVADLAVFLASDAAAYITGSTYFIDGGMRCRAGKY